MKNNVDALYSLFLEAQRAHKATGKVLEMASAAYQTAAEADIAERLEADMKGSKR